SLLSGLTNLTQLYLYGNKISDISSLSGLTNLTFLNLHYNEDLTQSQVDELQNKLPDCKIEY
ncbi:MAG: leucine-rich repeat domain-containing protein, partial [Ruminiclostridium sp.]